MADEFKALVELTKQTNAKLDLLQKQGENNDSPRERILDALPEILNADKISKKEVTQKDNLHREEVKKNKSNLEELKKADAERSKQATKNSQAIKQQNQMIVSESHNDTAMVVASLGNVEKSQNINQKIQLRLNQPDTSADEEEEQKQDSFFKKMLTTSQNTNKFLGGIRDGIIGSKIAAGAGSIWSKILKVGLIGGLIALVNFLSGPYFDKFYDTVLNTVIPAFVKVYEILKPIVKAVGGALLNLLKDIGGLFAAGEIDDFGVRTGPKSLFDVLMDNKFAVVGIIALLAPKLLLKGLFAIPMLLTGAFGLLAKAGAGIARGIALTAGAAMGGNLTKGALKPGTVNKATGNLVGLDGRDTTIKRTDKGFKAAQKNVTGMSKKSSNLGKVLDIKKYKNLFKVARAFWPLNAILSSVMGVQVLLDTSTSMKEKIQLLGGLVGQALGASGFAALGAVMGSVLGPVGAIAGGLIGGLGGAIGGEALGQKLVGLMLGEEKTEIDKALGGESSSEQAASPGALGGKTPSKLTQEIMKTPLSRRSKVRKSILIAKKSREFRSGFLGEGDSFFSGLGEIPIEQETIQKRNPNFNQGGFGRQGGDVAAVVTNVDARSNSSVQGIVGAGVPLVDFSHFGQLAYHGHPNN